MSAREADLVELVDPSGDPIGAATVADAHNVPGKLHRAFSVFLVDDQGRALLQQRASAKTRFPLRWGNTCCGHPAPGEDVAESARKRLAEELGIAGVPLVEVGVYAYFAEDPVTGRVEREYDHVLVGRLPADTPFRPDSSEVARLLWVPVSELRTRMESDPEAYVPWLGGVTGRLLEHLAKMSAERSGGE